MSLDACDDCMQLRNAGLSFLEEPKQHLPFLKATTQIEALNGAVHLPCKWKATGSQGGSAVCALGCHDMDSLCVMAAEHIWQSSGCALKGGQRDGRSGIW